MNFYAFQQNDEAQLRQKELCFLVSHLDVSRSEVKSFYFVSYESVLSRLLSM